MKAARLVVLVVAVAAGGVAALLAGRSGDEPPPAQPVAATQIDTVDVLVAQAATSRSGRRCPARTCSGSSGRRRPRAPLSCARSDKPDAIEQLSGAIARAPFVAGEPIREAKLIKANGSRLHGRRARQGHARDLDRNLAGNRRGRIHPAERPRRRDPVAARPRSREVEQRRIARLAKRFSPTSACSRSTRRSGEKDGQKVVIGKTATLELSPRQSETLALSRQLGTLSLALRSLADAGETDAAERRRTRCGQARRNQHGALRHQHHVHAEMSFVGDE